MQSEIMNEKYSWIAGDIHSQKETAKQRRRGCCMCLHAAKVERTAAKEQHRSLANTLIYAIVSFFFEVFTVFVIFASRNCKMASKNAKKTSEPDTSDRIEEVEQHVKCIERAFVSNFNEYLRFSFIFACFHPGHTVIRTQSFTISRFRFND